MGLAERKSVTGQKSITEQKSATEHKSVTEDVVDYLKEKILDGTWKPGDKISSENKLPACRPAHDGRGVLYEATFAGA